ncbi:MAG: hypothetical protein M1817_001645 [Caeruleum heppii]|nr:MAG: hypothetical protein M1817_001645 [Caeruleum heppii]
MASYDNGYAYAPQGDAYRTKVEDSDVNVHSVHAPFEPSSSSSSSSRSKKCYKPAVVRAPVVALLLLVTLVLIGLIEWATRVLPTEAFVVPPAVISVAASLEARQVSSAAGGFTPTALPSDRYLPPSVTPGSGPGTSARPSDDYLPPVVTPGPEPGTSTRPPGDYLPPTVTPAPGSTPVPSPGGNNAPAGRPAGDYIDPSANSSPTIAASAPSSAYLGPAVTPSAGPPSAGPPSAGPPSAPGSPPAPSVVGGTTFGGVVIAGETRGETIIGGTTVGVTMVGGSTVDGKVVGQTTVAVSAADGTTVIGTEPTSIPTGGAGDAATDKFNEATRTTGAINGILAEAQATSTTGPNRVDRPVVDLTGQKYFVGAYLAILLAVLFRMSVGFLYAATKALEPFYSLTEPSGASPKDFFNINYLATNDSFDPFFALFSGHWLMLWTSILYVGAGLLTPFASELLSFSKFCNVQGVCGPEMRVNPVIGRVMQALLAFTAVLLVNFWLLQRRHSSGVYTDPSSIATMASLLHHPEVLEDFRRLDPSATKLEMEKALAHRRYRLGHYRHFDGSERYGVVVAHDDGSDGDGTRGNTYSPVDGYEQNPAPPSTAKQERVKRNHKIFRLVRDIIFGGIMVGILILIAYYYAVGDDSGFERFMDSQGFGPRFMFSIVGMLLHGQWKRVERELCILEPFRRLSRGNCPPERSILIQRPLSSVTTFLVSLPRRHFFVALVAFITVISEVLIITLAGIPYNPGQLYVAFRVSAFVSMAILSLMILILVAVYLRPKGPDLPRTPNTVAAVWSYLCASSLVEDFADLSGLGRKERNERVKMWGRSYVLSVERRVDGALRWGVDYDGADIGAFQG